MIYPSFLKKGSTIGITAPSSGVGKKLDEYDQSLNRFIERGYSLLETKSVRNLGDVSNTSIVRAKEFMDLVENDEVSCIICATGGNFLFDFLPHVNFSSLLKYPKWVMGASDPTTLLYTITTSFDIATLYGHNAGSFEAKDLDLSQEIALDFLEGKIRKQESYPYYEKDRELREFGNYALTEKSTWLSNQEEFEITGRIIGGCLDCLRFLPGTPFDSTKQFIEKYQEDGIIWYFDVFTLSVEDFYLSLCQLKESGWFSHVKGVLVGRIKFPSSFTTMTYEKALYKIFGDLPIIMDADIGHVAPKMTIMNGSIAHITYQNHKGVIEQLLK